MAVSQVLGLLASRQVLSCVVGVAVAVVLELVRGLGAPPGLWCCLLPLRRLLRGRPFSGRRLVVA